MTALVLALALAASPQRLDVPGLGAVPVFQPKAAPTRVVLLLPGLNGWKDDVDGPLAEALAARGALVVGADIAAGLPASGVRCAYPAGRLETLAQAVEQQVGMPEYLRPTLVGFSRGAAVAWAALSQAPGGTFRGAVLAGFCAERPLPFAPCAANGIAPRRDPAGARLVPGPVEGRVAVLHGAFDTHCPRAAAERFAGAVPGATFAVVPGAGHGLLPTAAWASAIGAQLDAIDAAHAAAAPPRPAVNVPSVADLPLVEVPAAGEGTRLVVLFTGDGGWVGIDKGLSAAFARAGVAVVGIDSLRYFWKKKSLDDATRDLARVLAHYRAAWKRPDVVLVGYSRGADIVPFLATRLPDEQRAALKLVAMLGPSTFAELEVHVVDLFSSKRRADALPTEDAVRAARGTIPFLCLQGSDEHDSLCPALVDLPSVKRVVLVGGHHFDEDYGEIARMVLDAVPKAK